MARKRLSASILVLFLFSVALAGCGGAPAPVGPGPAATPLPAGGAMETMATPVSSAGSYLMWEPQVDMGPVVRNYLANQPEAWGLIPAQAIVPGKTVLVDVRQPEEYQTGFIQGAINIPLRELARALKALPAQDKEVVMVCDTGARGAIAMVTLQLLGWKQAKSLYGGMKGWAEAKLPVVTSPAPKRPANAEPKVDAALLATMDGYLNQRLLPDYGRVSPDELVAALALLPFEEIVDPPVWAQGPPFLIDVSEPSEFAQGSIGKAISMPIRSIPDSLDMIPWYAPTVVVCGVENTLWTMDRRSKYIVTICPNGHRSAVSMVLFHLLGFHDVHALDGGIKAWKAAGK